MLGVPARACVALKCTVGWEEGIFWCFSAMKLPERQADVCVCARTCT